MTQILKKLDQTVYNQYKLESYSDNNFGNVAPMVFEQPKFKTKSQKLLDNIVINLSELDEEHEAVKFCLNRNIIALVGGVGRVISVYPWFSSLVH